MAYFHLVICEACNITANSKKVLEGKLCLVGQPTVVEEMGGTETARTLRESHDAASLLLGERDGSV
jgi:hypothetical protein